MTRIQMILHSVTRGAVAGTVAGTCLLTSVSAQSLADVARQEEVRRRTAQTGQQYTNENLRIELPPSAPPPRAGAAFAVQAPVPGAVPDAVPAEPQEPAVDAGPADQAAADTSSSGTPRDEQAWRQRIADERDALRRAEIFAEALQTRINALSADFVNRDDPFQRNVIAGDRQKALDELERVNKEVQDHHKAIETIQREARQAGVPAGWVR